MSQNWNPPPGGSPPGGYGGPPPGGYGGPPPGGYGGPPPGGYGAPPPGGFGASPPGGYGGPPVQPYGMQPAPPVVEGNIALGFLAGFFGGCIGLILVMAIAKGPQTKRGAGIGFAAQIVIGAILRIAAR